MTVRNLLAVAFALCAPSLAWAATESNFDARTTADLAALCGASTDTPLGAAAVNFCDGFAEAAIVVELQNLAALRAPGLFCLPNPPPSRTQAMGEFTIWAKSSQTRLDMTATDGLFQFLSEKFPCPASTPPASR